MRNPFRSAASTSGGTFWLAVTILLFLPLTTSAQLALDPAFGVGGKVTTQIVSFTHEGAVAMVVDASDRMWVAYGGYDGIGISRHHPDGTLDLPFGEQGIRRLGFYPRDLLLLPDNRIIVVGSRQTGGALTEDWQVTRLLADGSIDETFASDGVLNVDWYGSSDAATSVALDAAGNVLVAGRAFIPGQGTAFALLELDSSGGIVRQKATKLFTGTADICQRVLVQSDDKIICAGLARNPNSALMAAVRFLPDFQLDASYGSGGLATVTFGSSPAEANAALLQPDGALVLAGFVDRGYDRNLAMARLAPNGALDTTFGTAGRVEHAIAGESDETIEDVLLFQGGLFTTASTHETGQFALLRFSANGGLDTSFGNAGLALAGFHGKPDNSLSLAVHQGALLVGGSARAGNASEGDNIGMARFLPNGTLDLSFSEGGLREISLRGPVNASALGAVSLPDGSVVAAGHVGITFPSRDTAIARYLPDGSLDASFGTNGIVVTDFAGAQDDGTAITVQSDGRLLLAGQSRIPPATSDDAAVARYTSGGALDMSFGVGGKVTLDVDGHVDAVRAIKLQADGRIVLAGDSTFPSFGHQQSMTLIRLMPDGSRDSSFGANGVARVATGSSSWGYALAIQSDGKALVGGISNGDFAIARFDAQGALDSTFGNNGIVTLDFSGQIDLLRDLLIVPDWNGQGERILAVGTARNTSSAASETFAAALFDLSGFLEMGFGSGGMVMVNLAPGQYATATSATMLGDTFVLAGYLIEQTTMKFAVLALNMDGDATPLFTGDGSVETVGFFEGLAQANAIVTGPADKLTLVGLAHNPQASTAGQMFALARFADVDQIFSDGFD